MKRILFIWTICVFFAFATFKFVDPAHSRSPYLNEPPELIESYSNYQTAKATLPALEKRHRDALAAHSVITKKVEQYTRQYRIALTDAKEAVQKTSNSLQSLRVTMNALRLAANTPDPQIEKLQEQLDALNSVGSSATAVQSQDLAKQINELGRSDIERRRKLREQVEQQARKVTQWENLLGEYQRKLANLKSKTVDSGFSLSSENDLYFDLREKSREQRLAAEALKIGLENYWAQLEAYTRLYAKNAPIFLETVEIKVDGEPHYRSNFIPEPYPVSLNSEVETKIEIAKSALPLIYEQISRSSVAKAKATERVIELNKIIDEQWADFDTKNMRVTKATIAIDVVVTGLSIGLAYSTAGGASVVPDLILIGLGKAGAEYATKNVKGAKDFAGSDTVGQVVSGDTIEFNISNAKAYFHDFPKHFKPILLDAWDKTRGKNSIPVRGIKPGTLSDILSPQAVGLSVLGTAVKAGVAQALQNRADDAAQRYWSTIIELDLLTKLIYEEREFIKFMEKLRQSYERGIADYVQRKRLAEKNFIFKQVRTLDKPWADARSKKRKKQTIEIELGFSAPLADAPVVKLHGEVASSVERSPRGVKGEHWKAELVMKAQAPFELERFILDVSLWPDEKPLTKLDSNPATVAMPKPIQQDWLRYEPGSDRNHGLLTRKPIPDLNSRWVVTSPLGFDRSAGSYLFRTVQTDARPELATTDDRNAEPIKKEKHNLRMTVDYIPERVTFLCNKFPDPEQRCVQRGALLLEAKLEETKKGPAYVGLAFPYQSNSKSLDYKSGLPVIVRFGEFGELLQFEIGKLIPSESTKRFVPTGTFFQFERRGTSNAEKTLSHFSQDANRNAQFYGFTYIISKLDVKTGEPLSEQYPAGIGRANIVVPLSELGEEKPWTPPEMTAKEKTWLTNYLATKKTNDQEIKTNEARKSLLDKAGSPLSNNGLIPIPRFETEPIMPLSDIPALNGN